MSAPTGDSLIRLREAGLTIADPGSDVRERTVVDAAGEEVGTVDDLLVDAEEHRVRLLRVRSGGFLGLGAEHFLVPVDAVSRVTDEAVHIDRDRSRLTDVPRYDPDVEDDPVDPGAVYGWWGYPGYWAPGYAYPLFPY